MTNSELKELEEKYHKLNDELFSAVSENNFMKFMKINKELVKVLDQLQEEHKKKDQEEVDKIKQKVDDLIS